MKTQRTRLCNQEIENHVDKQKRPRTPKHDITRPYGAQSREQQKREGVLDVKRKKSHSIIGDRSVSKNPSDVLKLGSICIDLYKKNKIATVIKHIPGHGLSTCARHFQTPIIRNNKRELLKNDFKPFKNSKSLFSMTAQIIYSSYDSQNTATHQKLKIKNVISTHIKYKV